MFARQSIQACLPAVALHLLLSPAVRAQTPASRDYAGAEAAEAPPAPEPAPAEPPPAPPPAPSSAKPAVPATTPTDPAAVPVAATLPAASADDAVTPWAVGGFVDTQYIINSNFPDNHIMRGTVVTSRTGEFSPNLVVAYIRRDPIRTPWMFELALQAGPAADALYYTEPIPGGDAGRYAGVEVFKHIGRANVGVKLRSGTEIAAGLMVAPTHFGSFWAKDNWHSSITWGYSSVPFFLMGARVYQPIGDKFGVGLWLANAYGLEGDNNKAPSGLLNLVAFPIKNLALVQNVYAGPEDASLRPEAWRLLLDSQVVYNTEKWGIAVVGDYGREKLTFKAGSPVAQWANGMVSVRWHVLGTKHRWGMAVRPEVFWDRHGRIFSSPDRDNVLLGATFTNDLRFFDAVMFRLEYRFDHSTAPSGFFYRGAAITDDAAGLAADQHSIIFNFIGYFERRIPRWRT